MAEDVGRTQIIVDADTRPYERGLRRTEKTSEKAGIDAGDAFSEGAAKGVAANSKKIDAEVDKAGVRNEKSMGRHGRTAGKNFGDGFWKQAKTSFSAPWQGLDDDVRLVIGAIAVSFSELAALGSGLSAALTSVASSLAFAGAGAATFSALLPAFAYGMSLATQGLEKIKKIAPEASAALDGLKSAFNIDVEQFTSAWSGALTGFLNTLTGVLNESTIAQALGGAFAGITEAFDGVLQSPSFQAFISAMETSLPTALENVGVGVAGIAEAIAGVFAVAGPLLAQVTEQFVAFGQGLAKSVEEATKSGALEEFLTAALRNLNILIGIIGDLGRAFGNIFGAGLESGEQLMAFFGLLAQQFADWTESIGGQNQLAEWFEQGRIVLNAVLPLIVAVAQALATVVTPDSVAQLVNFLGALTNFIPLLTQILALASSLGVFDIFAQILTSINTVLTPIMPQLQELATILGEALLQVVVAITPLVGSLVQVIAAILPAVMAILPPLANLITTLADALTPIIEALTPIIEELADEIGVELVDVIKIITPIIRILGQVLTLVARIATTLLVPAMKAIFTIIGTVRGKIVDFISGALQKVADWLQRVVTKTNNFREVMNKISSVVQSVGRAIKNYLIQRLVDAGSWVNKIVGYFNSFKSSITAAIDAVVGALSRIHWPTPPSWLTNGISGISNFFAEGGLVTGPTRAVIGEAGPEMVIPLARPLSQVDPAVRDVAAFAQGKMPAFASGGIAGGGTTVAAGAIQIVSPYANPRLVAEETLNALVLAGK